MRDVWRLLITIAVFTIFLIWNGIFLFVGPIFEFMIKNLGSWAGGRGIELANIITTYIESDNLRKFLLSNKNISNVLLLISSILFIYSSFGLFLNGVTVRNSQWKKKMGPSRRIVAHISRFGLLLPYLIGFPSIAVLLAAQLVPATNGEFLQPIDFTVFVIDNILRALTFDLAELMHYSSFSTLSDGVIVSEYPIGETSVRWFNLVLFIYRASIEFTILYILFTGIKQADRPN